MSAALQNLDFDIVWDQWMPPASLIDKSLLKGVPQHGIGRACKVGKETIVGVLTALDRFVAADPGRRHAQWLGRVREIEQRLRDVNAISLSLENADDIEQVPLLRVALHAGIGPSAAELTTQLQNGSPSVNVDPTLADDGVIIVNPMCLKDQEVEIVADRLRAFLLDRSS